MAENRGERSMGSVTSVQRHQDSAPVAYAITCFEWTEAKLVMKPT